MPRPSKIAKLDEQIRNEITQLRMAGVEIDDILQHLRQLHGLTEISRSGLARHIKGLDKITEKMRRSRTVAEALVQSLGEAPEAKAAQLNVELMHSVVMDLIMRHADGEEVAKGGAAALAGEPQGIMMLAKALDHLSHASNLQIRTIQMAEERGARRMQKEAAAVTEAVAKTHGISADTIAAIKAGIFGIRTEVSAMRAV